MTNYLTETEFRDYIGSKGTSNSDSILAAISAGSRSVDAFCARHFDQRTTTRYYTPGWSSEQYLLPVDDIATTTGLAVATTTANSGSYETSLTLNTDFTLEPRNQLSAGLPWPYTHLRSSANIWPIRTIGSHRDTVSVTATFGWPTAVPDEVKQATRIIAAQLWKLGEAPFGVAGWGAYGDIRVREVPQAAMLLAPYRRGQSFGIA